MQVYAMVISFGYSGNDSYKIRLFTYSNDHFNKLFANSLFAVFRMNIDGYLSSNIVCFAFRPFIEGRIADNFAGFFSDNYRKIFVAIIEPFRSVLNTFNLRIECGIGIQYSIVVYFCY